MDDSIVYQSVVALIINLRPEKEEGAAATPQFRLRSLVFLFPPKKLITVALQYRTFWQILPESIIFLLISAMGWKPFKSYQEQQFVDAVSKPSLPMFRCEDSIIYSIITVNDNVPIGFISLKGIDWGSAKAELAVAICDNQYRSGGYGTEALTLGIDHAFNNLKLFSIYLSVFPSNTRAIRVYEKIGFKHVDRLEKSWTMPDGEKVDMLIMSIEKKADY